MSQAHAVILAGTSASRPRAVSQAQDPRELPRDELSPSPIEATIARLNPDFPRANILIVTSEETARSEAFRSLAPYPKLLEPTPRGTASAIALAATHFLIQGEDPVMVVMPAAPLVREAMAIHESLRAAIEAAAEGKLVTLGLAPTGPESRFGYVRALAEGEVPYKAERFKDRPDTATAAAFLEEGGWYWNSGFFAWRASAIVKAIEESLPVLNEVMSSIYVANRNGAPWQEAVRRHFDRAPAISIERGVLERAGNLHVVPVRATAPGEMTTSRMSASVASETVHRPWGSITLLAEAPGFKVRRLEIIPNGRTSLQSHEHRSEHWVVTAGRATVTKGGIVTTIGPGQSTFVPPGAKHRLENRGIVPLLMIEVQAGGYIGDDDIKRYE